MSNLPEGLVLPKDAKVGGNCGVTATAIAAGISFEQAWGLFKKHCPRIKRNARWAGMTYDWERKKVMDKLDLKYKRMLLWEIFDGLPKRTTMPSLKKFVEWKTVRGTLYIVTTTGHVQIVKDDWVIDQMGSRKINEFWGRNKIIRMVETIIPKRRISSKTKFANHNLFANVNSNPRRKETFGYYSMEIILNNPGITYENYLAKGGRLQDLNWDLARNRVKVSES